MTSSSAHDPSAETIVGDGAYQYRVVQGWGKLPKGWILDDVAAVAVDKNDNVYVFNRSDHPMMIFDRSGNFLTSWGEGVFSSRAHGLHIGPDGFIYCTDDGGHCVRKCTLEGEVLLTIGIPNKPSPFMSGEPFNRCTHTALSPDNESIYVSDGYHNARVHKYSQDGKLLFSWGECGIDPGQFNLPHNICCDEDGWVYVADRESHRVQIFDENGKYETQWAGIHRPMGLYLERGPNAVCYIGELPPDENATNGKFPNLGARISIVNKRGELVGRLGGKKPGYGAGEFFAPHGLATDSRGDLYVAEVAKTRWPKTFSKIEMPQPFHALTKLVKVP